MMIMMTVMMMVMLELVVYSMTIMVIVMMMLMVYSIHNMFSNIISHMKCVLHWEISGMQERVNFGANVNDLSI